VTVPLNGCAETDLAGDFGERVARGKTHTWIKRRTQHGSDAMISRYDHAAGMLRELQMGTLVPLHEAIPELAEMEPSAEWLEAERSLKGR
jgi:hypothetical protein